MLIKKSRVPIFNILTIGILPGFIKKIFYKLKGAKIGKKVGFGFGSVLISNNIEIGDYSSIGFGTIIRAKSIKIGRYVNIGSAVFFDVEKVEIGDDAKINEQVFAGGPMLPESFLKIGARTIIMQYTFLNPTKPLIIGDDTGIGGHCLLFTHGSWQSQIDGYPVTFGPITLGKNVWLPWRIFIMPGVTIGEGTTIGADSLVNKSLPPKCLAAGIPAKIIRQYPDYPKALSLEEKKIIIENILEEFIKFISYNNIEIERVSTTPIILKINYLKKNIFLNKKVTGRIIFVVAKISNYEGLKLDKNSLYLSLPEIDEEIKKFLKEKNTMWIDLSKKERWKSNLVGEELVNFLKRYGIRLCRID